MKKFKKIAASLMAVAAMATSMVGMNASALSDSYYLQRTSGAPSSTNVTTKSWSFTAAYVQTTMAGSTSFESSSCKLELYSSNGINCSYGKGESGSTSANTTVGTKVSASAKLTNCNSGTNTASGTITG